MGAAAAYRPGRWEGSMHLVTSSTTVSSAGGDATLGWRALVAGALGVHTLEAEHTEMLHEPHLAALAQLVDVSLNRV